MAEKFTVEKNIKLLDFLFLKLQSWPKKRVKQRLQNASVRVNEIMQNKHDFALKTNDIVEIGVITKTSSSFTSVQIIYQDKDIVLINKPSGLLSVSSATENKEHALAILRKQLSRGNNKIALWPVHRLDRDTSGLLLFATSKEGREQIMSKWPLSTKTYLTIVDGILKVKKSTINEPLRLDEKIYKMHVGKHIDAKEAITHYEVLKEKNKRSLLKVNLETGRQHQIRAHMAYLGHSVIGDERYGKKGPRMALHACELTFYHPKDNKKISFKQEAPKDFYDLLS
ncbi:MAG: RNA pseudouridine synthase [Arcobacter sp.]|nr:MAG: RNA pseudouridine synthase [Arcobacter sp.]